jgi:hypothetical protein
MRRTLRMDHLTNMLRPFAFPDSSAENDVDGAAPILSAACDWLAGVRRFDVEPARQSWDRERSRTGGRAAGGRCVVAKRTEGESRIKASSKAIEAMVSKLDPFLILGALATGRERAGKTRGAKGLATDAGPVSAHPGPLPHMELGIRSLTAQMGPKALESFQKEDLVPVLVDSDTPGQVEKKVEQWNGRSKPISATTLSVHVPRTKLGDPARLAKVKYVEASHRLKPHCDLAHASTGLILAGQRTAEFWRSRTILRWARSN